MKRTLYIAVVLLALGVVWVRAQNRVACGAIPTTYRTASPATMPYEIWTNSAIWTTFDRDPTTTPTWLCESEDIRTDFRRDAYQPTANLQPLYVQGALQFDGVDDCCILTSNALFTSGGAALSYNVWINTTNTAEAGIFGNNTTAAGFSLYIEGAKLLLAYNEGGAAYRFATNSASFCDGAWHMVTVTKPAAAAYSGVRVFVDAAECVYAAGVGNFSAVGTTSYVGVPGDLYPGARFRGKLDDFAYFGSELTPTQITNLYVRSKTDKRP